MSCIPRGNKGFGNLLQVQFIRRKLIPHENNTPAFPWSSISDVKMLLLSIDEIPAISSNFEPGAVPKLAHAYYVFPLCTRSEGEGRHDKRPWNEVVVIVVHRTPREYLLSHTLT